MGQTVQLTIAAIMKVHLGDTCRPSMNHVYGVNALLAEICLNGRERLSSNRRAGFANCSA